MQASAELVELAFRIVEARGAVPVLAAACRALEESGCDPELELYACLAAMELDEDVFIDTNLADDAYVAAVVLMRRSMRREAAAPPRARAARAGQPSRPRR